MENIMSDKRGKIYVGTSLRNSFRANQIQRRFELAGCEITYDWTTHGQVYNEEQLEKYGVQEELGVKSADVFFMISPARNGSHCELGLARAFGVKIVLLLESEQEDKTFYYLPELDGRPSVSRFKDATEAINYTLKYLDLKHERSDIK